MPKFHKLDVGFPMEKIFQKFTVYSEDARLPW